MMLATNKEIRSKEDVIKVAKIYFSRWRIEEYFRCKKQRFQFENFRIRKLAAINALNFYITLCMAFLAHMSMKPETNAVKVSIIQKADPVKEKVHFCYYRLAKGICGILLFAKEGIRLWFRRFKTPDGAYLSAASRVASNLNDSKIWQSISSMIFWGPPGVGKTTLARIIANHTRSGFVNFSAVTSGIREKKRTGRSGWKRAAASGDSYCCSLRYSSTRFVRFFITVSSPTEPAK